MGSEMCIRDRAPPLWVIVAGLALGCTGVFISQAAATTYIGSAAQHDRALAVGLYVTFYYIGGSAGGAIPGFIWKYGGWTGCVLLIVLVQLATLALALIFWSMPRDVAGDQKWKNFSRSASS